MSRFDRDALRAAAAFLLLSPSARDGRDGEKEPDS